MSDNMLYIERCFSETLPWFVNLVAVNLAVVQWSVTYLVSQMIVSCSAADLQGGWYQQCPGKRDFLFQHCQSSAFPLEPGFPSTTTTNAQTKFKASNCYSNSDFNKHRKAGIQIQHLATIPHDSQVHDTFCNVGLFYSNQKTTTDQSVPPTLTMAKDCGDNGPSGWLMGACGGAGGGGACWFPLEIFRLAMSSSNSVEA